MTADAEWSAARAERELLAARRAVEALATQVEEARQAHAIRDDAEAQAGRALREREAEIARARHSIEVLAREIEAARIAHDARDRADAERRQAQRAGEREVAEARGRIEALTAEIARARKARDQAESDLRAALAARETEVADARRNIESLVGEVAQARQAHTARDGAETDLRDALAQRDGELEAVRRHADALAREVEQARTAHAARDEVESELRRQLEAREVELERALAAERALSAGIEERDHAVADALREVETVQADLLRRAQEQARLAADLEEQQSLERELELILSETEREAGDMARAVRALAGKRWYRLAHRLVGVRSSAPRRAIDPATGPFALDGLPEALEAGDRELTGWYIPPEGVTVHRMGVRAGRRRFEGVHGLPRPDVAEAYRGLAGAGLSGFRVSLRLPAGDHRLVLEVQHGDGSWHLLGARETHVCRPPLRAHFDLPIHWTVAAGAVRFFGWCCHPQARVTRVRLTFAEDSIECAYGLPRADVAARFPDHPGSLLSGFDVVWHVRPGRGSVVLRAELDTGEEVAYTSATLVVLPELLHVPAAWVRQVAEVAAECTHLAQRAWRRYRDGGGLPPVRQAPARLRDAVRALCQRQRVRGLSAVLPPVAREDPRTSWQRVNRWHERAESDLRRRLTEAPGLPRLSVVSAGARLAGFERALQACQAQPFADWELCLAAEGDKDACARLKALKEADARVRARCVPPGAGRAEALNAAAALATGDVVVVLTGAEQISSDLLGELALYCAANPHTALVYADHEQEQEPGCFVPVFKPGWSPERLLSDPYPGGVLALRRSVFESLHGFHEAGGAEAYDLQLRTAEGAGPVAHLPLVGYREAAPEDGADRAGAAEAARRAADAALARRGLRARTAASEWPAARATPMLSLAFPDDGPTVAVIVSPGRDGAPWPVPATDYRNMVVVQRPSGAGTPEARIKNAAARGARADYLLFVDASLRPADARWLSVMAGYACFPGVGAVGARLRFPAGTLQHAGFELTSDRGRRGPVLVGEDDRDGVGVAANRVAVSGACLLTPRRLFEEMGGFDEGSLGDAYHDLDYCFRVADHGYRAVCAPVELMLARDLATDLFARPDAEAEFRRRHQGRPDPYASPHLEVRNGRVTVRPRRLARPPHAPVRALMCSFNLNREGAPLSQFELTVRLKDTGVLDPVVFCPKDGPLRDAYAGHGIEVHIGPHPLAGVFADKEYTEAISSFAGFVRQRGVDLVYGNTVHTFYAIAAAEHLGLPSVWNPRESERLELHFAHFGPAITAHARHCFRHPYRVVFVAEATRQVYAALESTSNFTVVHNGLDRARLEGAGACWPRDLARRSLGMQDGDIVFLLLGTVCERKGQVDLPLALGGLPEEWWPRLRCLIVGEPWLPYSRRVHAAREALPDLLRDRVHVLPETDEAARYYRAADVFVCTSRVESFPRVTLEAMAHGLPLVTTPAYGISEQVREGVNALLYEPGDVAGLTAALTRVLEDEPLRHHMSAQARPVLECLNDFDTMAAAYAEIFREAALSRGRAAAASA